MTVKNPQNPYQSFIVQASAGCGKTYQLSRRFLFLVGAGASPESILTLTFTRKAAGEMRERILSDAADLLSNPKNQKDFEEALGEFYHTAIDSERFREARLKPPLKASIVGERILSSSQLLKITTIDSVFFDWVRKFPWEAARIQGDQRLVLPPNFRVLNEWEADKMAHSVWQRAVIRSFEEKQEDFARLAQSENGPKVIEWQNQALSLDRLKTFLWLVEQLRGQSPFNQHPEIYRDDQKGLNEEGIIKSLTQPLLEIIEKVKEERRPPMIEAVHGGQLQTLIKLKLLTKDAAVSKGTIRGKKRDELSAQIDQVDTSLKNFINQKKLASLNETGHHLMDIYQSYAHLQDQVKAESALVEFDDLAKGCFRLQHDPLSAGARYLIQRGIRHLMLDEFQDTSLLQWSIFEPICGELLAGEGIHEKDGLIGLKPTLFVVGDEKQSIYGFREADPDIIKSIAHPMKTQFGVELAPLNQSFRTSQLILDYVNGVFAPLMKEFPSHSTAKIDGSSVVPTIGSVRISPLFEGEDALEEEATFLAKQLAESLKGVKRLKIYDKALKTLRGLEPKDCGILFRAATHADAYEKALRAEGIATIREDGQGFLSRPEIMDLRCLIKWLAFPDDSLALGSVLKSPLFRIPDTEVLQAYEKGRDALQALAPAALKDFIQLSKKGLPHEVLWQAIHTCHALEAYVYAFGQEDGQLAEANILLFLERLLVWQREGLVTFSEISEHLDQLASYQGLPNAKTSPNAVTLMTIHKSKGLEFPLVALVGTGHAWHKRDLYWAKAEDSEKGPGVYYMGSRDQKPKDHNDFDQIYADLDQEAMSENERLLYVAITRARHHLIITGREGSKTSNESSKGFYEHLKEAITACGAKPCEHDGSLHLLQDAYLDDSIIMNQKAQPTIEEAQLPSPSLLPGLPSEIESLAPHRLLHQEDPVPSQEKKKPHEHKKYAQAIGTFIHKGIETYVKKSEFNAEIYWLQLIPHITKETRAAFDSAQEELKHTLDSTFFSVALQSWKSCYPELEILQLHQDQLIRGAIDLYLEDEDRALIIDYKTTREVSYQMTPQELKSFAEKKGYPKQLALYKQAIKSARSPSKVSTAVYFTHIQKLVTLDAAR